jgi:hypothetical protein
VLELDVAGVADALLDDWLLEVVLDAELVVELLLVLVGVLATALPIGLAAITPTRPVNATPVSAVVTRRPRTAGWRRREPGRPALGERRLGGRGGGDTFIEALTGDSLVLRAEVRIHLEHKESASRVQELGKNRPCP